MVKNQEQKEKVSISLSMSYTKHYLMLVLHYNERSSTKLNEELYLQRQV